MMPNLDRRSDWPIVSFGDVVTHIKDRVQNVMECGLQEYIRGEHFEPANLRLIGRSTLGDGKHGSAFCMRFRPGDVLYVSRNPQLRKAAIADFEGICANTTYVCRAKEEYLLQDLLPFIMQTESFVEYTIRNKRGSTNFYLNWSDIAGYEFALPPLEEQRRIAEVLQSANASVECLFSLATSARSLRESALAEIFSSQAKGGINPSEWKPKAWQSARLGALVKSDSPICYGIVQWGEFDQEGVPAVTINDLDGDFITGVHKAPVSIEANYKRSRVRPGDVVISIKATIGDVAIIPDHFEGNISRQLAKLRLDDSLIRPRFFFHLYKSPCYQRYLRSLVVGSTRAELSIAFIRDMEVPFPSLAEQDRIVNELDVLEMGFLDIEVRQKKAKQLMQSASNATLSEEDA